MHERSFARNPTIVVAFGREGWSGRVRAYYGATARPRDSGFSALKGWADVTDAGVGFPTIKCTVESERPGYYSALGWIQWVTQDSPDPRTSVRLVDRLPSMLDRDIPFAAAGYAPTFFDAPAHNTRPEVDWRARLFLVTVPLLSRRESIIPLLGFRWGYHIDSRGARPNPYPLEPATPRDWRIVRRELVRRHPEWKFASELRKRTR